MGPVLSHRLHWRPVRFHIGPLGVCTNNFVLYWPERMRTNRFSGKSKLSSQESAKKEEKSTERIHGCQTAKMQGDFSPLSIKNRNLRHQRRHRLPKISTSIEKTNSNEIALVSVVGRKRQREIECKNKPLPLRKRNGQRTCRTAPDNSTCSALYISKTTKVLKQQ